MNHMSRLAGLVFLLMFPFALNAYDNDSFQTAVSMYGNGMYARAMSLFQQMPDYGSDPIIDGYVVKCAQKQHTEGYRSLTDRYLDHYCWNALTDGIRFEKALDLFDSREYAAALDEFRLLEPGRLDESQKPEYHFKKGYCLYMAGDNVSAEYEFTDVSHLPMSDYTAPAWYCMGYVRYVDARFEEALPMFAKAAVDERFAPIANYYLIVTHYELKDYDFVVNEGVRMFGSEVPADRKAHLARIISESYLVKGDKAAARRYFDDSDDGSVKTRADWFYAGSLMFATGDWKGTVENYDRMPDKTDSLGQIAYYNTALAYINLKNKVAALGAFKQAASLSFDPAIREDAMFNYAKLSFDLNGDTSVFHEYMNTFSDSVRGERIHSYMALAALNDKDYQSAIGSYDKIDVLEGKDRENYIRANYLRGAELMENGSYRNAVQSMKTVAYYTAPTDRINQLARFALAEAYYRDARYSESAEEFVGLYNASALDDMPQGESLPYNAAYSYLKAGDLEKAYRWYDVYCKGKGVTYRRDALTRKADCLMSQGHYAEAADEFGEVLAQYGDRNDIYPYYQCGVAYGLAGKPAKKLEVLKQIENSPVTASYYPQAAYELGKSYQSARQTSNALDCYRKIVDSVPASVYAAKSLLEIGTIERNARRTDKALEAYCRVVEQMPSSECVEDALLAIESIYKSQGRPDKYLDYLQKTGHDGNTTPEQKEEMLFDAAQQMFYSEDYPKTLDLMDNFKLAYPRSSRVAAADYYQGECYRMLGDKIQACDAYLRAINAGRGDSYPKALKCYADLNLSLENFDISYTAYDSLRVCSTSAADVHHAEEGMMESAYKSKKYDSAVEASASVMADTLSSVSEIRRAKMINAKSLLSLSHRDEAFARLGELAGEGKTAEGAEANYMIIMDLFDKGDFASVEEKTYAFSDSGTTQEYWLAKAFIILGDSFAEQGKMKQAEATFRSIAEGYSGKDEIAGEIKQRLDKISELKK